MFCKNMFLKSIHLENFKKFKELDLEFSADLTVIKGPNEQGKSTIVSALGAGLFYDPKKDNAEIRQFKSWHSDEFYKIKMNFEADGNEWELVKDFQNRECRLTDKNSGKILDNYKEISEVLYQMGGYRNVNLFYSTACVAQDALNDIGSGKKEIEQALQDLITSGADNVSVLDIIKKLDKAIVELEKGSKNMAKNPGIIKLLNDSIEKKRGEYRELEAQLKNLQDSSFKLENVRQERDRVTKDLEIGQAELEAAKQFFISQEKIEKLKQELQRLEDDLEILGNLEKQDEDWEKEARNLNSSQGNARAGLYRKIILFIAGVFVLAGFFGFFISKIFLLALVPAIFLGWRGWRVKETGGGEDKIFEELNRKKEKNQAKREGILRGKNTEVIKEEHREFLRQRAIEQDKIDPIYKQNPPTKKDSLKLEQEISGSLKKKDQLGVEQIRLESVVASKKDYQEEFLLVEESAADLKKQLEYENNKLEVYKITKDSLFEAKDKTIVGLKEKLKEYINSFIFEITHSRYSQVALDSDLNISVYSSEKKDHVEVNKHLSRGTVDQFYLVIRFALLEILSFHKKPLIILDDPFVNFDKTRREHTKHICEDLARRFQILLFTHSDDYDDWGRVIKLEI